MLFGWKKLRGYGTPEFFLSGCKHMPDDLGMVLDTGQTRQMGFVGDEGHSGAPGGLHVYLAIADKESLLRFGFEMIQHFQERFRVGLRVSNLRRRHHVFEIAGKSEILDD